MVKLRILLFHYLTYRKWRFLSIFICLFFINLADFIEAQQIQITNIDNSDFPLLRVKINYSGENNIDFNELKILENGETTIFSVDSTLLNNPSNAICVLIEGHLLNSQYENEIIIGFLRDMSLRLNSNDMLNIVISTEDDQKKECIYPLSFEYTDEFEGLIQFLVSFSKQNKFSEKHRDFNCSISSALDFIDSKKNSNVKKILLFVYRPDNQIFLDWEALQSKAAKQSIELKSIEIYTFEQTDTSKISVQSDLLKVLDSMQSINSDNMNLTKNKSYIVSFYSSQSEKVNQFEIKYKKEKIRGTFVKPGYSSLFKDYGLIIGTTILFVLLVSFFILRRLLVKQKKQLLLLNDTKAQNSSKKLLNESFDVNKRLYGSGSIAPYITVDMEGDIQNHELKKLRTTIGRHSDNDILIPNLTISNHHAIITKEGGVFYIQDNESTNGTFVNEIKISKSVIKNGDTIRMGKAKLYLTY